MSSSLHLVRGGNLFTSLEAAHMLNTRSWPYGYVIIETRLDNVKMQEAPTAICRFDELTRPGNFISIQSLGGVFSPANHTINGCKATLHISEALNLLVSEGGGWVICGSRTLSA